MKTEQMLKEMFYNACDLNSEYRYNIQMDGCWYTANFNRISEAKKWLKNLLQKFPEGEVKFQIEQSIRISKNGKAIDL